MHFMNPKPYRLRHQKNGVISGEIPSFIRTTRASLSAICSPGYAGKVHDESY